MAFTTIKLLRNSTGDTGNPGSNNRYNVSIQNLENPGDTGGLLGQYVTIYGLDAGEVWRCSIGMPWHSDDDFCIEIWVAKTVGNGDHAHLYLYQRDGYVFYRQDGVDYLVQGAAQEGGDRTVEVVGTNAANIDLVFH